MAAEERVAWLLAEQVRLEAAIKDKDAVIARLKPAAAAAARPSRFVGASQAKSALVPSASGSRPRRIPAALDMPRDIAENAELDKAVADTLPKNYNFEIKKSLWRIRRCGAKRVALQLPEGLLMFACPLSDLFERFANVECLVMSDVTYGACCVDDFGARALGCQLLIHYGHSCLVPVDVTKGGEQGMETMYVFVDIHIDAEHLCDCVELSFPEGHRLVLMGTIQFVGALYAVQERLRKRYTLLIPQAKPLSGGEVLGCTSPSLAAGEHDALVFVADGRFHLESAMIANPTLKAFRYDPYSRVLTEESYDTAHLARVRGAMVERGKSAVKWGVVQGTLGRQGNPKIVQRVVDMLQGAGCEVMLLLLSEITPGKLALMDASVDCWVQIACPRLSTDWGEAFAKPLLTPYEAFCAKGGATWMPGGVHPQDYYAKATGPWGNYHAAAAASSSS